MSAYLKQIFAYDDTYYHVNQGSIHDYSILSNYDATKFILINNISGEWFLLIPNDVAWDDLDDLYKVFITSDFQLL